MKRGLFLSVGVALLCATVGAQQQAPQTALPGVPPGPPPPTGPHIYLRTGLKTHGAGQHDYPQFLGDWSKILTDRNALVDGSLHFPKASELEGVDVIVMYKGDTGYMTAEEKTTLENFLKRGGGLVSIHDALCGPDPAYYSTILGGAKKHGEVNYTLDANVPYTVVDKANPIMEGMSDVSIRDEAFYLMTWAQSPKIHVLATAKIDDTPSARSAGHVGEEVPQIWTYENTLPGGQPYRVFVWMQGHEYSNFTDIRIEPMLLKGIAWAAKKPYDALLTVRTPAQRGGGAGRGAGRGEGRGGTDRSGQ
ncbi:MAG TPA: ThuA domain-containing protein [Vicinamibacterales bacterium]|jgi:type 1 glutamine amidotransferase